MKTYHIIVLLGNGNIMKTIVKADKYQINNKGNRIYFENSNQDMIASFPTNSIIISEEELVTGTAKNDIQTIIKEELAKHKVNFYNGSIECKVYKSED